MAPILRFPRPQVRHPGTTSTACIDTV
jgi:inositol phosphorylceramide synthase regulatory subunit